MCMAMDRQAWERGAMVAGMGEEGRKIPVLPREKAGCVWCVVCGGGSGRRCGRHT